MHDPQLGALWLIRQFITEHVAEKCVHDRVEPFLGEPITVFAGLPDVDVAQAALGAFGRDVHDEARVDLGAEPLDDPLVERGVDRHVLCERVGHDGSKQLVRMGFGCIMGWMNGSVKKRSYAGEHRQAASAATRQRIIDAGRELVLAQGYRATTVAAIAARADVNVDTVYQLVGRKSVLLRELIEQAISGQDRAVLAEERAQIVAVRAEPDPAIRLAMYARSVRETHVRLAPLFVALRDAAATESDVAEMWREISDRRAANMRKLVSEIQDAGHLRDDLQIDDAGDTVWATNSPELFVMLTEERGWTPDHYERWLTATWQRLLLE